MLTDRADMIDRGGHDQRSKFETPAAAHLARCIAAYCVALWAMATKPA